MRRMVRRVQLQSPSLSLGVAPDIDGPSNLRRDRSGRPHDEMTRAFLSQSHRELGAHRRVEHPATTRQTTQTVKLS
jgi:hypothetical protein